MQNDACTPSLQDVCSCLHFPRVVSPRSACRVDAEYGRSLCSAILHP